MLRNVMAVPLLLMRAADLSDVDNLWQLEVCVSEEFRAKRCKEILMSRRIAIQSVY